MGFRYAEQRGLFAGKCFRFGLRRLIDKACKKRARQVVYLLSDIIQTMSDIIQIISDIVFNDI